MTGAPANGNGRRHLTDEEQAGDGTPAYEVSAPDGLCDPTLEVTILGAMLTDQQIRQAIPSRLRAEDFAVPQHRTLFAVLTRLAERGTPNADPPIVTDELRRMGEEKFAAEWSEVGLEAIESYAAGGVDPHVESVRDLSTRRRLLRESDAIKKAASDLKLPVTDAVASTVDRLVDVTCPGRISAERTLARDLGDVLSEIEHRSQLGEEKCEGYSTGIKALDLLTDGLVAQRQITLAARKKKGKTTLALNLAGRVAGVGAGVHFASGEMPRKKLLRRLAGIVAGLNLRELRTPERYEAAFPELVKAFNRIATWPLRVDDQAVTPNQIRLSVQRTRAELAKQGIPLKLVVCDYLTKFRADEKHERQDLSVGEITGKLSRLALDLDVCVLLLAQLNRDSEKDGKTRRPTATDLRDSGIIEQDCDQMWLLWDGPLGTPAMKEWPDYRSQLIVELNRYGPTGEVDVTFPKSTGRIGGYLA